MTTRPHWLELIYGQSKEIPRGVRHFCRRIREQKDRPYIYLVLLTAKSHKEEIATGTPEKMKKNPFFNVEPDDLLRYGLIPELVGRLPVAVPLDALDEDALVRILIEPKNALLKQYQKLFELENVRLTIEKEALKAIAQKAIKRGTGARGLRAILEEMMTDIMFELPSRDDVREVAVTAECVTAGRAPLLVTERPRQKKEA